MKVNTVLSTPENNWIYKVTAEPFNKIQSVIINLNFDNSKSSISRI